jgi:hypothetical protein
MTSESTHNDIIAKVPGQYEDALKSGDLLHFPSTIVKHIELDIDVRIIRRTIFEPVFMMVTVSH